MRQLEKWLSSVGKMYWKVLVSVCFLQSVLAQYGPGVTDPVSKQLLQYKQWNPYPSNYTTSFGTPVCNPGALLTAGRKGPGMLSDTVYFDEIARFDRERIPERILHAKGAGAIGFLTITKPDMAKYCKAPVFSHTGKVTPAFVRFSTSEGESGSPDTMRGLKGMTAKFYTEEGNLDIICLSAPVFWIRDPSYFISIVHASKRNPVTNLRDYNMFWDFVCLEPSAIYTTMLVHSKLGIPTSYRHMNGYAINTYALYDHKGNTVFCKFNFISNQGVKGLDSAEADRISGADPNSYIRDLYNCIEEGKNPSWNFTVQIMTPAQAKKAKFDIFDPTKYWLPEEYPFIEVGRLDLVSNVPNYHAFVEQSAFCPGHLVPGIGPTVDKVLQARIFAYSDAANHRLGVNHKQIPVNSPYLKVKEANNNRDGLGVVNDNQDGAPNYYPNSFNGPKIDVRGKIPPYPVSGLADRYDTGDDDNFSQARLYFNKLTVKDKQIMIDNIVETLSQTEKFVQDRCVNVFLEVDTYLGDNLKKKLGDNSSYRAAGKK